MAFRRAYGPGDRGTFERFRASIEPEWIEEALRATGTGTLRRRRLPAEQMVWLVLGMALFRDRPIPEVVSDLDLALPDRDGQLGVADASVVAARARLGAEPMKWLFERTASQWAQADAKARAWRGLSVFGVDGTSVRVPDSKENREHFGKRSNAHCEAGYPLLRVVTVMALRSHLLAAVEMDSYEKESEYALAKKLLPQIPTESLCVVDRGFFHAELLEPLSRRGVEWLTRGRKNTSYKVVEELGQGDCRVELKINHAARKRDPNLPKVWSVRAIRYCRKGFQPQLLFTSLTDPKKYPADEIIALYHERWELELGYDEVKTDLLERVEAIRSQKSEGVYQEAWGILLAYNLIRLEMARTAEAAGVSPTRISFLASLRYIRKVLCSLAFTSPGAIPKRLKYYRQGPEDFVLPPRRSARTYARAVKIKMSHYARQRERIPIRALK